MSNALLLTCVADSHTDEESAAESLGLTVLFINVPVTVNVLQFICSVLVWCITRLLHVPLSSGQRASQHQLPKKGQFAACESASTTPERRLFSASFPVPVLLVLPCPALGIWISPFPKCPSSSMRCNCSGRDKTVFVTLDLWGLN